jgi:pheromone a factor receptor
MHPELPLASGIIALLVLVPLPAQLRARNIALITLLTSTSILNITYVINSLMWAKNVRDMAPIWCDIGGSRRDLSAFDR